MSSKSLLAGTLPAATLIGLRLGRLRNAVVRASVQVMLAATVSQSCEVASKGDTHESDPLVPRVGTTLARPIRKEILSMRRSLVLAITLLLAACGGGHSTSSTPVSPGTYRGTLTLTVGAPGVQPVTSSGPVVLVVSPDQVVTVGSFPGAAPVSHNFFSLPVAASALNGPGLTCPQGTITIDGTFSGPTVNGSVSSDGVVCNGVPIAVTGSYTATLQAEVPRRGADDADLVPVLQRLLMKLLR
jgi:hypothetical protein